MLFGALAAVDYRLLASVPEPGLRVGLAVAAAFCLALGLMSFWNLARGFGSGERSREAMIERAHKGVPPEDGQPMIATGQVRSLDAALTAPLSGIPCVSYQYRMYYEVLSRGRRRQGTGAGLLGVRLARLRDRLAGLPSLHPRRSHPEHPGADPRRAQSRSSARAG